MNIKVGILGAGAMGSGIAQVASQSKHDVVLVDTNSDQLEKAKAKLSKVMDRLVEKERVSGDESSAIQNRIQYSGSMNDFAGCGIVIEAIIENLDIKKAVFAELESICGDQAILATNTSSLSVASIAAACKNSNRVLGVHFFNPAPLMPLV